MEMKYYNGAYTGAQIDEGIAAANAAAPQSTTYTKVEVDTALSAKLNTADVDTALSSTSTNPVQNKAVQAPIAKLVNAGAKNLLSVNSGSATDGYVFDNLAINLPSGSYVFLANIANYESRSELVIMADGEEIGGVVFNNADSVAAQFNITREGTIAKLYTNGGTFTNMMLCTEEDYAISPEFVPYAKSNYELTQNVSPIPGLVDAGAKNLIDILHPSDSRLQTIIENANGTYTLSGSGTWLVWDVVCSVKLGTKYIFRCNFTNVSTDGRGIFVIKDANNSDLFRRSVNNDVEIETEIEPSTATITIGFSTNNSSTSGSGSFTMNPMLCTAEDYAISPEFVPYAPSNRELYEMILALQNAQNGG